MRKEIELITQMTDSAATVIRRDDYVRLQSLFDSLDGVVPELAGIFCPENRADAVLITLLLVRRRFPFVHLTNVDEPNSCNIIACSASSENNQELRSKYPEYMGRILGTNIIFLRRPGRRRIFFEGGYYVMRTSGTTSVSGREVTVPLRNLISDVDSIKEKLGIRSLVTGILLSPFTFDPSLVEIMVPLSCPSGTLIIPQVSVVQAPNLLYDVIVAKKVSLLMMTPTLWMRFTESQRLSLMFNPVVHDLILGGEPFPSEFLHEIYRRLTGKNHYLHLARMWNIYGTTESSVWATLGQIPPPVYKALQNRWEWPEFDRLVHEGIPIGSPLNGKELFISFDTSNLVAEGDFSSHKGREGELWIGGDCRCLVEGETEPMKIRPTGDLIKVNDSGDILIVGRVDEVFKRNGLRIIPHAVAAVLKDSIGYLVKDCM
jgi:acyl-CoA synthetase (AMP-forming)/AMP-acid ligase II